MGTIANLMIIILGAFELGIIVFSLTMLVQLRNKFLDRTDTDVKILNELIDKNYKQKAELDNTDNRFLSILKKQREDLQLVASKDSFYEMDKVLKELISKKDKEIEQFYHD